MSITSTTAEKLANLNVNLEITPEANYTSTTVEKLVKIKSRNGYGSLVHLFLI